jgi:hypothetical protein
MSQNAFGDSVAAARRIELLADMFEPASRPFLKRFARPRLSPAFDLGCEPGYITHLMAEVLRPRRVLWLDHSPSFVPMPPPADEVEGSIAWELQLARLLAAPAPGRVSRSAPRR